VIEACQRACLMVVVLLVAGCAATLSDGVRVMPDGVRFQIRRPGAASVAVAGDFNGWSPTAHPMTRSGDLWTGTIAVPPGEHLFMYVVDGTWVTPPNVAEVVPDGFGGSNGRVVVP
jgi:1,4-alpha-glucan branching enzyme